MLLKWGGSLGNGKKIIMLGSRCQIIFVTGFLVKPTPYVGPFPEIFQDVNGHKPWQHFSPSPSIKINGNHLGIFKQRISGFHSETHSLPQAIFGPGYGSRDHYSVHIVSEDIPTMFDRASVRMKKVRKTRFTMVAISELNLFVRR